MSLRAVRNLAFVIMTTALVLAGRADVFAWNSWDWLCQQYRYDYNCSYSGWAHDKQIRCDLTGVEEADQVALNLASDGWPACREYCDSDEYYRIVALQTGWGDMPMEWLRGCFWTWETYWSGWAEPEAWATCDCNYMYICEL
jgi:hypothetical protein